MYCIVGSVGFFDNGLALERKPQVNPNRKPKGLGMLTEIIGEIVGTLVGVCFIVGFLMILAGGLEQCIYPGRRSPLIGYGAIVALGPMVIGCSILGAITEFPKRPVTCSLIFAGSVLFWYIAWRLGKASARAELAQRKGGNS